MHNRFKCKGKGMAEFDAPDLKPVIAKKYVLLFAAIWAAVVLLGLVFVENFAASERQRDMQYWQRQLQLTVEAQKRQIEKWIASEQSVIDSLASNTSLKLYLLELQQNTEEGADQAFTSFLSNLLISQAQQYGYTEPSLAEQIPANIPSIIGSGLGLFDAEVNFIVATASMPNLSQLPAEVRQVIRTGGGSPVGPFTLTGRDDAYMMFHQPVASIQSSMPQGHIIGIKSVGRELGDLLALPPQAIPSSESYLIRLRDGKVEYLTSLADNTKPMTLTLDANTPNLLAAEAANKTGQFIQQVDYAGNEVLAVAQAISGTSWYLIHKVDKKIALSGTMKRAYAWVTGYLLLMALITVALIAVWRNVSATRARQAALHYQQLSNAAEKQRHLMSHLTNTLIMLVDSRDPHAQHHSNGVAMIAAAIAEQMDLSPLMKETTSLAASLMNVGKIKTADNLLLQKELSKEEKDKIRHAMLESADILKGIHFDGPVVETLRQSLEHVDGSGPLGLTDEDILVSAKIIGVANAFVAMVSARAYREAMNVDQALEIIHHDAGKVYAKPVVAALQHYIENAGGRQTWERIQKRQVANS